MCRCSLAPVLQVGQRLGNELRHTACAYYVMAHTFRNLWPRLVSWDNLLTAYARCRRKKRSRPEAAAFDFAWEEHLLALQGDLVQGT